LRRGCVNARDWIFCIIEEGLTGVAFCYILLEMSTVIRVSDDLATVAKARSGAEQRSMAGQIEYWAKVGRIAEDNPDLPYAFIKETLIGVDEIEAGLGEDYVPGS